jgi:hypothetical protein
MIMPNMMKHNFENFINYLKLNVMAQRVITSNITTTVSEHNNLFGSFLPMAQITAWVRGSSGLILQACPPMGWQMWESPSIRRLSFSGIE